MILLYGTHNKHSDYESIDPINVRSFVFSRVDVRVTNRCYSGIGALTLTPLSSSLLATYSLGPIPFWTYYPPCGSASTRYIVICPFKRAVARARTTSRTTTLRNWAITSIACLSGGEGRRSPILRNYRNYIRFPPVRVGATRLGVRLALSSQRTSVYAVVCRPPGRLRLPVFALSGPGLPNLLPCVGFAPPAPVAWLLTVRDIGGYLRI